MGKQCFLERKKSKQKQASIRQYEISECKLVMSRHFSDAYKRIGRDETRKAGRDVDCFLWAKEMHAAFQLVLNCFMGHKLYR